MRLDVLELHHIERPRALLLLPEGQGGLCGAREGNAWGLPSWEVLLMACQV
ncbi:hypothetical protein ACFL31_04055 [Candidatus Margulisiibacteriota bacterium]